MHGWYASVKFVAPEAPDLAALSSASEAIRHTDTVAVMPVGGSDRELFVQASSEDDAKSIANEWLDDVCTVADIDRVKLTLEKVERVDKSAWPDASLLP